MGRPSDTREVLIAEALGDFVKVLDRIDAVMPTLDKSCSQLKLTADRLEGDIVPFQGRIGANALEIQGRSMKIIAQHAKEVGLKSVVEQMAAMQESARKIFKEEIGPPLSRVAADLRAANLREEPAWMAWLTHASAAICAACCTCLLMLLLLPTVAAEPRAVTSAPSPDCAQVALPPLKARDRR